MPQIVLAAELAGLDDADGAVLGSVEANVVVPPQGGYLAGKTCERKAHNDNDVAYAGDQDPLPPTVVARMSEGNVFETKIGDLLRDNLSSKHALFLPYSHDDLTDKIVSAWERETVEAMESGVRFIWNARFPRDYVHSKTGEPDYLVRVGSKPKENGKWAYAPGDVKHHRTLGGTAKAQEWFFSEFAAPWPEVACAENIGKGIPQLRDITQLMHYHVMLENLGYAQDGDVVMGSVIGKEERLLWVDLSSLRYRYTDHVTGESRMRPPREIYDMEFAHKLRIVRRAIARGVDEELLPLVDPEKKAECGECVWKTVCRGELKDLDHITLIPGITPARAKVHYEQGVTTSGQLARLDWHTANLIDAGVDVLELYSFARAVTDPTTPAIDVLADAYTGRNEEGAFDALARTRFATAKDLLSLHTKTMQYSGHTVWRLADSIDQARVMHAERVHRRRGVEHVAMPRAAVELDVDMENGEDHIYLWGTKLTVRRKGEVQTEYRAFASFAGTDDGEYTAFVEFWAFLQETRLWARESKIGGFKAYCYTEAENRCMRALVAKYDGKPGVPSSDELEAFLASDDWVDMHAVITTQTLWPTEDSTLKTLAKYIKFAWRDTDPGGANSVAWYNEALASDEESVRNDAQQRILDYNEDDVVATFQLREWLSRLGEARRPGAKLPSVANLDRRFRRPLIRRAATP